MKKATFIFIVILAAITSHSFGVVSEQRVALVIGNGSYEFAPLENPVNDASDIAAVLEKCGFSVTKKLNCSQNQMKNAIRQFGEKIRKGGVGLFYYAGHGIQVKGENYLVPVEAEVKREYEVDDECIKVSRLLGAMEYAGNRLNIVILDACRNNPFKRSFRSTSRGLARMDAPVGSFIAYATSPGSMSAEGAGRNGIYTSYLLKHIQKPELEIEDVFKEVRRDVMTETEKQQIPWESSSMIGDFVFLAGSSGESEKVATTSTATQKKEADFESDKLREILSVRNITVFAVVVCLLTGLLFLKGLFKSLGKKIESASSRVKKYLNRRPHPIDQSMGYSDEELREKGYYIGLPRPFSTEPETPSLGQKIKKKIYSAPGYCKYLFNRIRETKAPRTIYRPRSAKEVERLISEKTEEEKAFKEAKTKNTESAWLQFLDAWPEGRHADEVRGKLEEIEKQKEQERLRFEKEQERLRAEGEKIRFKDLGDGTVKDKRTGLIWLKDANSCGAKTFEEANRYCENLSYAGYSDWRLPTKKELQGIGTDPPVTWDDGEPPPSVIWKMPGASFKNVQLQVLNYWSSYYWSSTTPYYGYPLNAWAVGMLNGFVGYGIKTDDGYVWPVRGGND